MMKIEKLLIFTLLTGILLSCGKEDEPVVTLDDIVGSWKESSFVFTNNSNTNQVFDLVANGGELRFTMLDDYKVRTWITFGTYSDEWDSQAEMTNSSTMTLTPAELERGIITLDFVFMDSTLELTNHNDNFDFTISGETEVSATSVAFFKRD